MNEIKVGTEIICNTEQKRGYRGSVIAIDGTKTRAYISLYYRPGLSGPIALSRPESIWVDIKNLLKIEKLI
jgi:hypothetical protein